MLLVISDLDNGRLENWIARRVTPCDRIPTLTNYGDLHI